jgi:protein-S-isoprenylcysteine O-methyltransferase Ste14
LYFPKHKFFKITPLKNLIGKTPINPFVFYTGKFAGYITWIILILLVVGIPLIDVQEKGRGRFLSMVFFSIGLILSVISMINLGSSTRLGLPVDSTELKEKGIYRLSRNPMYLGFNCLTLASIIYTFNAIILLLGIYSIFTNHLIIVAEENFLKKRFGKQYIAFKQRVRRYI